MTNYPSSARWQMDRWWRTISLLSSSFLPANVLMTWILNDFNLCNHFIISYGSYYEQMLATHLLNSFLFVFTSLRSLY